MEIRNEKELRGAYCMLTWINRYSAPDKDAAAALADASKEIKRAVRAYTNAVITSRVVKSDFGGATILIKCPSYVKDKEAAEEWFDHFERRKYCPSPYDCTGQIFTTRHSVFERNGGWYCYHSYAVDI